MSLNILDYKTNFDISKRSRRRMNESRTKARHSLADIFAIVRASFS